MNQPRLRIVTVADNNFAQTILDLFVASHDDFILVGKAHDNTAVVEVASQAKPAGHPPDGSQLADPERDRHDSTTQIAEPAAPYHPAHCRTRA